MNMNLLIEITLPSRTEKDLEIHWLVVLSFQKVKPKNFPPLQNQVKLITSLILQS